MGKMKMIIAICLALIIVLGIASFVSYSKFNVWNPFSTINGLMQITFTDKEYIEIQKYPKVIVAKPSTSLQDYMQSRGFKEDQENQMGALHMFSNNNSHQFIMYSMNRYFSKWKWQE